MYFFRLLAFPLLLAAALPALAQQPPGIKAALDGMTSQPGSHAAITFDRDMLAAAGGYLGAGGPAAALDSITVENYRYHEPAFYIPESMAALNGIYRASGWKHLVDQNATPRDSASPQKPLTDLWLHFQNMEIDDVTVLIRAPKQMSVIEVSGHMRPLDFVHLSGHFGIPKVDPNAVMVPAPPNR